MTVIVYLIKARRETLVWDNKESLLNLEDRSKEMNIFDQLWLKETTPIPSMH